MLYIYAFYSVEIPKWKGYTPKQVKFIMERAFHKCLDKKYPRMEPTPIDGLGSNWAECTYRFILFLLYLKN
jgi:hypothetical protein